MLFPGTRFPQFPAISSLCAADLAMLAQPQLPSERSPAAFKAEWGGRRKDPAWHRLPLRHRAAALYTALKLLLDALSSTRYKLHNVFKCLGEIAFRAAPPSPSVQEGGEHSSASLTAIGISQPGRQCGWCQERLSSHLLTDTNLISSHLHFCVTIFSSFSISIFSPFYPRCQSDAIN